jgi:hypothetical protein
VSGENKKGKECQSRIIGIRKREHRVVQQRYERNNIMSKVYKEVV